VRPGDAEEHVGRIRVLITHSLVGRGVSGSSPLSARPRGREMLNILQPGDIVVTAKLDRGRTAPVMPIGSKQLRLTDLAEKLCCATAFCPALMLELKAIGAQQAKFRRDIDPPTLFTGSVTQCADYAEVCF
jgi:hypothetical protein